MFMDLTGECYWLMLKDGLQVPRQLWVIPAQYINPEYGDSLAKPIIGYKYERGNVKILLKPEDVVMFNTPNPKNIFSGFSTIRGVADAVYIQSQMNEFETSIFENRARVGGVIEETENVGINASPRCDRFSEKMNENVLPLFDEKLFCAFDDPVPKNRELILKEQIGRVKGNIMLINEARAEQGLEPIEGGDEMLVDNRLIPISAAGVTPPTPEEEEEQVRSFSKKVVDAMKEMLG